MGVALRNGEGMISDLKVAEKRELTLVDFAWIFAAIIVSLLICFCIVFFAKGANHLAATQTELLLRTPDPAAVARSGPESISETLDQSATVVNPPEIQSPSSDAFGQTAWSSEGDHLGWLRRLAPGVP